MLARRACDNLLRAAPAALAAADRRAHADRRAGREERRLREGHAHPGAAAGRAGAAGTAGGTLVPAALRCCCYSCCRSRHLRPDVDPIESRGPSIAKFGPFELTWHGIFTAVGIAAGVYLGAWLGRRQGITEDDALQRSRSSACPRASSARARCTCSRTASSSRASGRRSSASTRAASRSTAPIIGGVDRLRHLRPDPPHADHARPRCGGVRRCCSAWRSAASAT